MKDYKDTLLMPKTDFPMRGNLGQNEPTRQAFWAEKKIYEARLSRNDSGDRFTLPDGPPYANGDIHIGHALNKVLKDIIIRDRNMRGYHTRYVPGWDTHGLPIETALAKNENVDRKTLTLVEFRERCADYAMRQIDIQREQFKRLGILGEWEKPYVTMDKRYEASQLRVFAKMVERGLIFKGLKPVFWSPSSETALAEAEIEYAEKTSPSIYVSLQLEGAEHADTSLLIWTTTPWTLPANLAVAVDENLDYVYARVADKTYIFAEALRPALTSALAFEALEIRKRVKGKDLLGLRYRHPLYDKSGVVLPGHHVTVESGTGLVHIAPGHGEDDFIIGQAHGLETFCPVDERGHMTADAGRYAGLFIEKCSKAVVEDLTARGTLLKQEWVSHSYPHDWRTKQPVIFRATSQWFASIETLKPAMMKAVAEIEWIPAWGRVRMENMIRDREAWCISRQRAWGVPIPVFYDEDDTPYLDAELIRHIADVFEEHGSNAWFTKDAEALLPESYLRKKDGALRRFRKETDILDVWFDSGTSHQGGMVDVGLPYPADLYLEGSDQYRGWFNSSLTTGIAAFNESPYKKCLTHGFVLDGNGKKMSKSQGNVVDPIQVMHQLGADILRLWVASVDYQSDVRINEKMIRQVSETYRKIRNTIRFMLGVINDFNPVKETVATDDLPDLETYMFLKLDKLVQDVNRAYDKYMFDDVTRRVNNFMTRELSAFYLDYAKDVIYIEKASDPLRKAAQTFIDTALRTLLRLMTPIMPHTTEEAYQQLSTKDYESVYLENMPSPAGLKDDALQKRYDGFMKIRDCVLKALEEARNAKVIGKSLEARVILYPNDDTAALLAQFDRLEKLFITSAVDISEGKGAHVFDGLSIDIVKAKGEPCARCWHVTHIDEEGLCMRCKGVLDKA